MNWYKKAIYEESDWEIIYQELKERLGRDPTPDEVQEKMMQNMANTPELAV